MSNNSDYKKSRINLFDRIPGTMRSDTSHSLMENLFNRFLTKQETRKVTGYIGDGNPNAIVRRQIQENDVHRQAYQLQPILYNKIGSVEWMSSWYDLLNEAERMGIDRERMQEWLNLLVFNWAPPIDIDKFINYQDYYWYDPDSTNSRPQYITIRSRCTTATALVNFYQRLIDEFGATIPVSSFVSVGGSPETYNKFVIDGDYTKLFEPGFVFFYTGTSDLTFMSVVGVEYINNQTIVEVAEPFSSTDGVISQQEKLTLVQAERDCQCIGSIGWDIQQWDDNPMDPLWDGSHSIFISSIANMGPPAGSPVSDGQMWWDQTSDYVYQYSSTSGWVLIWKNFTKLISQTTVTAYWDYAPGCGTTSIVDAADQWISQNKWLHKTDVPNLSIAKQATLPIIEYDWDLELNEWVQVTHNWKYRSESYDSFETTDAKPEFIELVAMDDFTVSGSLVVLSEKYGDLTGYFTSGRTFFFGASDEVEVERSEYAAPSIGEPRQTRIWLTSSPVSYPSPIRPSQTSQGDWWGGYGVHWLYVGPSDAVPVPHQPEHQFGYIAPDADKTLHPTTNYEYAFTYCALEAYILQPNVTKIELTSDSVGSPVTNRPLTQRSLIGFDDIRVYVNGIRQYGSYNELSECDISGSPCDSSFVAGIEFIQPLNQYDVVRIEVGEATPVDFGLYAVPVRTVENNADYALQGDTTVSLIRYRKSEQVKTDINQYPLFDVYRVDGTPAYDANHIFGYVTNSSSPINLSINRRIVTDTTDTDYIFEQLLVDEDTGVMYAYRDYAAASMDVWVNPETQQVWFWDGLAWSQKREIGLYYLPAHVGDVAPEGVGSPATLLNNSYWYDTIAQQLKQYDGSNWVVVDAVFATEDPTLQTIWKRGLTNREYIPQKRDWVKRTLEEYNQQKDQFVSAKVSEYTLAGSTLSEATNQAESDWGDSQSNHLSVTGDWVGDWEIPDPLYYNVSHQNRKQLTYLELYTHFVSIIREQPKIPGYVGLPENMFHLIPSNSVDYGLGGTIHEYNYGFDTFLSMMFTNYISPRALYEFAQDQYDALLNTLVDLFRRNISTLLLDTSAPAIANLSDTIANSVLTLYEQNDNTALLYGDSTTFTDVDGVNDLGVRNWIATLPYLNLVRKIQPSISYDLERAVLELIHHDGHRAEYAVSVTLADSVARSIVATNDERTRFPTPSEPPIDTMGRLSSVLPPNDVAEFEAAFNTSVTNRSGVYWYYVNGPTRVLYRLNVIEVDDTPPPTSYEEGSLWLDTTATQECLRILKPNMLNVKEWVPVDGLIPGSFPARLHNGTNPYDISTSTISAWQPIDLNQLLLETVFSVEQKLYENAPDPINLAYDFDQLFQMYPVEYQQALEKAFLAYVNEREIETPYVNDEYTQADAFTWNYANSTYGSPAITGGYWKDLYQKVYGTPYPHLEPWKLQGYTDKPQWWDEEWLNDDATKWGDRRWKYKHGFEIVDAVAGSPDYFVIDGDFDDAFVGLPSNKFEVDQSLNSEIYTVNSTYYDSVNDQTWIYVDEAVPSSPETGRIALGFGMWDYIMKGKIPAGREYPNGVVSVTGDPIVDGVEPIPTYDYVSVNIGNDVLDSYQLDSIFPPYWDLEPHFGSSPETFDQSIRSLFTLDDYINDRIISPGANYQFGDAGPVEWEWKNSSQYLYDQMGVAFQLDPVRFSFLTFGTPFYTIGGLQINKRTEQVLSHANTLFHGDIVDDQILKFAGTNQWYVNYARYIGLDLSMSDFRSQWTLWTAPMTYQFASFVDTSSFELAHRHICVSNFDYHITSKRSPGVEDYWLDSFNVTFLNVPPKVIRYDNDLDWSLELNTRSPLGNTIKYYDVHNYQFYADANSDVCTLYTWNVTNVDSINGTISVAGDQTSVMTPGMEFAITNSTGIDGTYILVGSAFNAITNETIVDVQGGIGAPMLVGSPPVPAYGLMTLNYRTIPWETGDIVILSTTETLPVPLQDDAGQNGVYQYFIIVLDDYRFQLALTKADALIGNAVDITTVGRGNHYVGQITTTFRTEKTDKIWKHYAVDKTNVLEFTPPHDIRGLQTLINIVDGYYQYTKDQGWRINSDSSLKDFDNPSRFVSWQLELERLIDYGINLRNVRQKVADQYQATVDVTTNVWTFTSTNTAQFITGDAVSVNVSGGVYPTPLSYGLRYYMIRDSLSQFRLAATVADARNGIAIDITSVAGVGNIYITAAQNLRKDRPTFELNPFREGVWFRPPRGIISNLLNGPTDDVYNTQLIVDQYRRALSVDKIRVFRQDKETFLKMEENIPNDIELSSVYPSPYNNIHLAGVHLFIDTYEHVLIFNNETTEGQLLYDSFLGLNVTKFETTFNRQLEFTQRPNVGGQYLSTFHNQGADLNRNIEASVDDLRYLYDTYQVIEANPMVEAARASLGYDGRKIYLDNLNLDPKSQFVFWRGQIQNKGSINAVNAFVNSRRFVDAKVDEYWAVKIAEFGSVQEKEYVSMWLTTIDSRSNTLRLQFTPDDVTPVSVGFTPVSMTNENRWYELPDQLETLRNNGGQMYFDLIPSQTKMVEFDANNSNLPYYRHGMKCDYVTITLDVYGDGYVQTYDVGSPALTTLSIDPYIPGTNSIRVFNGEAPVPFVEDDNGVDLVSTSISFELPVSGQITVVYTSSTLVDGVHYTRVTSDIIKFNYTELFSSSPIVVSNMKIWGWTYNKSAQNPAKIIDVESSVAISPVQYWDPARGSHYYNGIHVVDLQSGVDPAMYNNTPTVAPITSNGLVINSPWNKNEVGTTWMDTSNIDYIPYFDNAIFSNIDDRSRLWGTLADWSDIRILTWVESDIPPSEWNDAAAIEEGDASIPQEQRKSGRIYQTLFENVGGEWVVLKNKYDQFDVAIEGTGAGTNIFTVSNITPRVLSVSSVNGSDIEVPGDFSRRLVAGMNVEFSGSVVVGSPLVSNNGIYEVIDVSSDGTTTTITVNAVLDSNETAGVVTFYESANVYVNGSLVTENVAIEPDGTFTVDNLRLVDQVRIVQLVPTDETFIAAEVESGMLKQEYQYTTDVVYNSIGVAETRYYFWVENKATKGSRSISPADARVDMIQIPVPYVFFQNVQPAVGSSFGTTLLSRTEIPTISGSPSATLSTVLPIESVTSVVVDGVTLTESIDYVVEVGGNIIELTNPLVGSETVVVKYIASYDIPVNLPVRFNQAVVRGLRGLVTSDYRYILRWTRDYTLRDTLDTGKTPLQNKNLHEEWQMIRREQPTHIPRWLWDRVTECIVGYKLTDATIRVPSYERELYDTSWGTDTQYGLGDGQAFSNGALALSTVLAYLNDSKHKFEPVDINVFFQDYNFDTTENIIAAMNAIYNTFTYSHVNGIFFEVLLDALSVKAKYEGIFKTSMIALHGVRPFETGGVFDD